MKEDGPEKDPNSKPPEKMPEGSAAPAVPPRLETAAQGAGTSPGKPAASSGGAPLPPAKPGAVPPKAAVSAPKPATPAKEAAPKPVPLDNELVERLKSRFAEAIREATLDRKQAIVLVEAPRLREISRYCREEEKFDMLTDLTAVDWPKREKRFDIILNLYSFPKNERLRLKAHSGKDEPVPSVCEVWPAANWLERECYDMFGIIFDGHPDLKRILMPDEWEGHPLRKDYDILTQDTAWVRENIGIDSGQ
jgi:NADH-quinone oxidoreductase subunit C